MVLIEGVREQRSRMLRHPSGMRLSAISRPQADVRYDSDLRFKAPRALKKQGSELQDASVYNGSQSCVQFGETEFVRLLQLSLLQRSAAEDDASEWRECWSRPRGLPQGTPAELLAHVAS